MYLYFNVHISLSFCHVLPVALRDPKSVPNVSSPGESFWCFSLGGCKQLYIHRFYLPFPWLQAIVFSLEKLFPLIIT